MINHALPGRGFEPAEGLCLGQPDRAIPARGELALRAGYGGCRPAPRVALRMRRSMMNAIMLITVPRTTRSNRLASRRRRVTASLPSDGQAL
jgi:hypothetical protein